ncbi:MAG: Microtubule-nucleating Tub4p (gamma-tubulin) complex component [Piccolia ochrophora]|nr:MAG: Microtubule-nucleating Tub4p (gamma-tubulin) complex component [Piccolia ochrophora]
MASDEPSPAERIHLGLGALVRSFLPAFDDEDEVEVIERRNNALALVKDIVDHPNVSEDISEEMHHSADLIKKKLIRDHRSPDRAVRFANLYSRLLTQPVLTRKWAVLHFLSQFAEPPPFDEALQSPSSHTHLTGRPPNETPSPSTAGIGSRSKASRPTMQQNGEPTHGHSGRAQRQDQGMNENAGRDYHKDKPSGTAAVPGAIEVVDERQLANAALGEAALLRDLPFTLQGVSSTNLEFAPYACLKLPPSLSPPVISLLHTLAEPSLLYRELYAFAHEPDGGLMGQSLRSAIGAELRSYLGLVATLEAKIRSTLSSLNEMEPRLGMNKAGVTLKRCVIWTREGTMALRLMNMIVEESKSKRGGQLVTLIHGFSSSHGDPFVGAFAERLLSPVTRPLYDMLREWIYNGELSDPHQEFFVTENHQGVDNERGEEARNREEPSVWKTKFVLNEEMVPSIMTKEFAKKVFLIGKSLNFIRHNCGDSTWVEEYSKEASKELRYEDAAMLERSIDEAYTTTMARLMQLMTSKFKLFEHLKALKKYLLLGQGDFISLLMESLSTNLDLPANKLFRHSLTAQLEHAIRGSNAQYDAPDQLRRLDARMLMHGHGDIGWECFTLEYKIDAPIDVIVTSEGSRSYLKVFNLLWRVKRVEFALGSTWRRCMTGARGVLAAVADSVGTPWKQARCTIAEMIHFVVQLQNYILYEVVESSWEKLQLALSKPGATLDDLIEAHESYLRDITKKGLLKSSRASTKDKTYPEQLHGILKVMLEYKDAVDGLYSFSVAEFTRRQDLASRIEARTAAGRWGITEADSNDTPTKFGVTGLDASEDHMLPALNARLNSLANDFRARLKLLLGELAYQPDSDMRFLGVVMNFNDVYEPVRPRRRDTAKAGKTPKTGGSARGSERAT